MFTRRFWYYVAQKIRPFFDVDMNGKKIGGLPTTSYPTLDSQAATKKYVDEQAPGAGDMLKATYDIGENDIVDNSEKLEGSSKAQVQDHTPKAHKLNSHSLPDDNVNLNSKKIIGLADPTTNQQAATKKYVDEAVVFPTPNYDSGFVEIANGVTTDFVHNLMTKDLLCQIFVRTPASGYQTLWGSNVNVNNNAWIHDSNTIKIANEWGVTKQFRLLLWKIP